LIHNPGVSLRSTPGFISTSLRDWEMSALGNSAAIGQIGTKYAFSGLYAGWRALCARLCAFRSRLYIVRSRVHIEDAALYIHRSSVRISRSPGRAFRSRMDISCASQRPLRAAERVVRVRSRTGRGGKSLAGFGAVFVNSRRCDVPPLLLNSERVMVTLGLTQGRKK
jgi:hypothetical protein